MREPCREGGCRRVSKWRKVGGWVPNELIRQTQEADRRSGSDRRIDSEVGLSLAETDDPKTMRGDRAITNNDLAARQIHRGRLRQTRDVQ